MSEWEPELTLDEKVGKAFVDKILELKKEFMEEFEHPANLLLIHPADARWINYYLARASFPYYQKDGLNIMPNDPSIEVLYDYQREQGSFLLNTRKALNRSGMLGAIA